MTNGWIEVFKWGNEFHRRIAMIEKCKVCGCQFACLWHEKTDRCSACSAVHYKELKKFVASLIDPSDVNKHEVAEQARALL